MRKLQEDEVILVNIAACTVTCRIKKVHKKEAILECNTFICAKVEDKLTLSRKVISTYRLIGWGEVMSGRLIN